MDEAGKKVYVQKPEYTEITGKLAYFRYREKFKLTVAEMLLEPLEEIHFAIAVWEHEGKRDKLEVARQEAKAKEQRPNK